MSFPIQFAMLALFTGLVGGHLVTFPLGGNLTKESQSQSQSESHGHQHGEPKEDPAVTVFREYLRINTAQPNPDYDSAIKWFRRHADYFGLEFRHIRFPPPGLFAVVFTWKGRDPSLKSVLFNTHMDVVTVDRQFWVVDPFEGYKNSTTGNIIARGAQDMKAATMAQLHAVRRLKREGFRPLRTVHFSIMPDEENSGWNGMRMFVQRPEFRALNVGIDLDEGTGNAGLTKDANGIISWNLGVGNKVPWRFNFTAKGLASHGSILGASGTAGNKLQIVMDRLNWLKYDEIAQLDPNAPPDPSGTAITTLNLVQLGGGYAANIVPDVFWALYDMRVRIRPGGRSWEDYETYLNETAALAGPGVSYTFLKPPEPAPTTVTNDTNPWWRAMESVCDHMNWVCSAGIKAASSDAKYVRGVGVSSFSYNVMLPVYGVGLPGAHSDNEAINELDWLAAIDRQKEVIRVLSSFPPFSDGDHDHDGAHGGAHGHNANSKAQ